MAGSKNYPSVSVIVLNLNGKEYLDRCLGSVLCTDYPNFEVVFVDNGSKDGSCDYVSQAFGSDSRLRIIRLRENKGFTEGNNVGIRNARGELLVILNNDTIVDKNWLQELAKGVSQDQHIGVAQSKLLSYSDPSVIDSVGGTLDRFGNGNDLGRNEKDKGQYDERREIFYATFAAVMIRRTVLQEVGLFDPDFFVYYEDADLCWRIRLSGYSIVCIPQSVVYHLRRGTSKKTPDLVRFHRRKNRLVFLIANHNLANLARVVPVVLLEYCLFFFLGAFLTGNLNSNLTFMEAILWNIAHFPYVYRKRLHNRFLAQGSSIEIADFMYKGNFLTEKTMKDKSFRSFF